MAEMLRLEWMRASDGETSESEVADMSLRVERDGGSEPPYVWEIHGVAQTRKQAFEMAERAALAALRVAPVSLAQIDALIGAVHRQCAYVVVSGKTNNDVLLPLLLAARQMALAAEPENTEPLEPKRRLKKPRRGRPPGTYRKPWPRQKSATKGADA